MVICVICGYVYYLLGDGVYLINDSTTNMVHLGVPA